jgi:hypothetical protein
MITQKIINMKKYKGGIKTYFWWLLPLVIGVSKSRISNKAIVYALHITPFFEIGFNWRVKDESDLN